MESMVLFAALGVVMMVADPAKGEVASDPVAEVLVVEPTEPEPAPWPEDAFVGDPDPAYAYEPMIELEANTEGTPPSTRWRGGPYFTFGIAPMVTMDVHAHAHPGLRYDMETGLAWQRGRARAYFGADMRIMQYFGRKKPGFGVDAMTTVSLRHVYARAGVGVVSGIPAGPDVSDTRPMLGGLVGGGLVGRLDKVEGRLGVDYDLRVDTTGRVAQTVLLALRLTFGP
jgi:hypothetical protein